LNRFVIGIECFFVVVAIFLILNSEKFQEKICPKGYWQGQVSKYNSNVCLNRYKIHELELHLLKEKDIVSYDLQALARKEETFDQDLNDEANHIKEKHEEKIASINEELKHFKAHLEISQAKLKNAKIKLSDLVETPSVKPIHVGTIGVTASESQSF